MEGKLCQFADLLVPSDEYIAHGQKMVEKVIETIRKDPRYSVDRTIYAGSIGKATEIMGADFDVVVFLNDFKPPFRRILEEWERILILGLNENPKVDSIHLSRYSVQFSFSDTGIEVDLLPATNLVKVNPKPGGATLAEVQKKEAMKLINRDTENHQEYSSSLAETQIYFLKQQGTLAHRAIRLAKFWLKSLHFGPERPYGIKTMIELIAVAAAMEEDRRDNQSLLRTFVKILDNVKRIDELRLAFENRGGRWTTVQHEYDCNCTYGIIDPGNHYNDLLDNLQEYPQYLANLKMFARITRERINPCVMWGQMEPLYDLFCPLRIDFPFDRMHTLADEDKNYQGYNPAMKINNKKVFDRKRMVRRDIEVVNDFLLITANSIAVSSANMEDIHNKLTEMIDTKLLGQNHTPWNSVNKNHENYDVTFTVPITTCPGLGAIKYSFTWL